MSANFDASEFEAIRPKLLAIAYRMLGRVMEAEDIVQEAYIRLQATNVAIRSQEAYLRTIVTRLCLDALRARLAERKAYAGLWLPEPVITDDESPFGADPAEQVSLHESISTAFLVLLETLSPEERAVFLLRVVFEYDYREIAEMMGKSEAACRQLLSRARKHIAGHRTHSICTAEEHHEILTRFLNTVAVGDLNGLLALLAEDVSANGDGGGKAAAAVRPVVGREAVARMFLSMVRLIKPGQTVSIVPINGEEGILIRGEDGRVTDAASFEIYDRQIQAMYFVRNPDKLKHLA